MNKMKHLLVVLLLLCSVCSYAQDVIVKKDGSTILCRVVELTSSDITYKRWNDLNGSNYVMNRNDASVINYQNGKKVDLSEATNLYRPGNQNSGEQQYNDKALLAMDLSMDNAYKKMKTYRTVGWIGGGTLLASGVVLFIIYGNTDAHYGSHYNKWALPAAIACTAGAVAWTTGFLLASNSKKKKIDNLVVNSPIFKEEYKLNNGSSISPSIDLLRDQAMHMQTVGLGLSYNF